MSLVDGPHTAQSKPSLLPGAMRREDAFDLVYPAMIRSLSPRFWTPVDVARRAAQLFRNAGVGTVLDVGAGVGKFALVAATAVPEIHFVGVEQRDRLVELARLAATKMRVPNASFLLGDAFDAPWTAFGGFYFFNPFAENLFDKSDHIDDQVLLTRERFLHDVLCVENALRACRIGTAVVTYHGMGAPIPACFELRQAERARSDWLRLWVKNQATDDGGFFLEMDDGIHRCSR